MSYEPHHWLVTVYDDYPRVIQSWTIHDRSKSEAAAEAEADVAHIPNAADFAVTVLTTHRFRIAVDGSVGPILPNINNTQWGTAAEYAEQRGLRAVLFRQLVTDQSIFPLLNEGGVKPDGWIVLKNGIALSPWEEFAVVDGRKA